MNVTQMNVKCINDLYAELDSPDGDTRIRFWMKEGNVSFAQLNFTEEELREKMHRVHEMRKEKEKEIA